MAPERFKHLCELYDKACELPLEQQAAFVVRACDDEELRGTLRRWLDRDAAAGERTAPEQDGQIGPYRVLKELGRGGFGIVYLADQLSPFRRQVALKVLKSTDRDIVRRFEAEKRVLAWLKHEGIPGTC